MQITVNGVVERFRHDGALVSYTSIATLAGNNPRHEMTITWQTHDRQGVLTRESEPIAIEADMAFAVTNCKNR